MIDYLALGPTPAAEDCQQVGTPEYNEEKDQRELIVYKEQLKRQFAHHTEGGLIVFKIKAFPHDFGVYREVCVIFDDANEESVDAAFDIENNIPEYWDDEAREQLERN